MTFTQLEYVIAVDNDRHFAKAAASCHITQPTLSMQIHKLESDLGVIIFDRSKQPVVPTMAGREIICQARKILGERDVIEQVVQVHKGVVQGKLVLGIIPTLAPYLLPLFLSPFSKKYPKIKLVIHELPTAVIIERLKESRIDVGLLVTPLLEAGIKEEPLFYEEMIAYVSKTNAAYKKQFVLPSDIDPEKLWLLEEGHCFRSQIVNICELRSKNKESVHFEYEAGSIETLRRIVEQNDGITIIPELATLDMTGKQKNHLRHFRFPPPLREVSLATHRNQVKHRLVQALKQEVTNAIPPTIKKTRKKNVVPISVAPNLY
ncbi:MAG: LysR substrate-binding domain-containing protein [Flavisolibacter sp.]